MRKRTIASYLRVARLALSGALAGVAIAGIFSGNGHADLLGAGAGFGAVVLLKVLHFV